jgi:hypothetical protein
VPAFELNLGGDVLQTSPIQIKVVDSASQLSQQAKDPVARLSQKLFVRMELGTTEAFVHQQVPLKIELYIHQEVPVRDIQVRPLEQVGFKLDEFKNTDRQQYINGELYTVYTFNTFLYPTRAGEITIGPAQIDANVLIRADSSPRSSISSLFNDDLFNSFFGRLEKRPVSLRSNLNNLTANELPKDGQPDNFTGAVGQYSFTASASPDAVKVGDPITVKMEILGNGDVSTVKFPQLDDNHPHFKIYNPVIKEDYKSKTLEQVVIPTSDELTALPGCRVHLLQCGSGEICDSETGAVSNRC